MPPARSFASSAVSRSKADARSAAWPTRPTPSSVRNAVLPSVKPRKRKNPSATGTTDIRISSRHPVGEIPEGERKTVTALFADIKGSTELMEDLDPEEARAIVDPALKLMIDAVHRYDGYVVQSTGDGIFALFGAPVAHEDHPQRALYAALRMQEELQALRRQVARAEGSPPYQVRVGSQHGEVVVRSIQTGDGHAEYTPIGHTTNLASRMQTARAARFDRDQRERRANWSKATSSSRRLGRPRIKGRQRAGQRLRGDRARAAAHAVAAFGRTRADQVRRARARDGGAEARRRAGQGGTRADRRGDGGAGRRQVAAVLRVQGDFAIGLDGAGDVLGLARQGVGLSAGDRSAAQLFRDCERGR